MQNLNLKYMRETYDDNGILSDLKLEYPDDFNFAYDCVDALAASDPDRPAMVWCNPEGEEHHFSFADIKEWSDKTAHYLSDLGIGNGDAVLVIVRRHYQFWFIATALHKLGALLIPATFMLKEHDLEYRIKGAGVKAVIATNLGDIAQVVDNVAPSCPELEMKILVNGGGGGLLDADDGSMGEKLSGPENVCILPGIREGWNDFNSEVRATDAEFARRDTSVHDPAIMYFSSGTTGNPKMVLHDMTYALAHIATAKHWHNVTSDGGLHFTIADTGWGKAVWGKYYGQWLMETCVFTYDFDRYVPHDILELIKKYDITSLCCPPTMYRLMMLEGIEKYDLSSLTYCTTAGEALNPDLYAKWLDQTGLPLFEGFGQTETVLSIFNSVGMKCKPGSMGKPSPLFTVSLFDGEKFHVTPGQRGEICIKVDPYPEGIMVEYYRDAEKTAEAIEGGWYHTGDTAWVDEDGYYWYVGRNDDVIKSSGYRIGPFEVESVLLEHEAVAECAVTGIPDPVRGFAVKATIVLAKGHEGSDELTKELQSWVKTRTAPYKFPRVIDYVGSLPKTVNGKVQRKLIRTADMEQAPQ